LGERDGVPRNERAEEKSGHNLTHCVFACKKRRGVAGFSVWLTPEAAIFEKNTRTSEIPNTESNIRVA
jgi:hypothetical protein